MQSPKSIHLMILILACAAATGCSRQQNQKLRGLSSSEAKVLQEDPFANDGDDTDLEKPSFDADDVVGGIEGDFKDPKGKVSWLNEDSLFPTNEPANSSCCSNDPPVFIKHCDPANYEVELKEAMERAAADPEKKTIVVRYGFSLGTPLDETAFLAYHRTILRSNDDGVTPVPIAPAASIEYDDYFGTRAKHYFADHVKARGQYVSGERCYFNTMKIIASEAGPVLRQNGGVEHSLPATPASAKSYDHTLNILYYGDAYPCANEQDCYRRYLSPRLFKANEKVTDDIVALLKEFKTNNLTNLKLSEFVRQCPGDKQPQILPLYVADFREQRLGVPEVDGKLINREFAENATRRFEYEVKAKKIFDLRNMFLNREKIAASWWEPKTVSGFNFTPYIGVAQLIDNIIFGGTNGTVLSTQYTPIVLDLPLGGGDDYEKNRHIHTSGVDWGTFFNMANLMWRKPAGEVSDIHHLTAWVGGRLTTYDNTVPPSAQATGSLRHRREARDGFLVIPDVEKNAQGTALKCSDGSPKYEVPRGESLFGAYAEVGGKITEYNHGFQKLRAWVTANGGVAKTCAGVTEECKTPLTADEMKSRYFGPWDGAAWNEVKVWLDRNRDGNVDCGEMLSMKEARIAALNTCQFEYRALTNGELVPSKDKYGNATHLRAAFLVDEIGEGLTELETLKRVQSGFRSDLQPAEFRVAIDVLFNSRTGLYLEDAPENEIIPLRDLLNATTTAKP